MDQTLTTHSSPALGSFSLPLVVCHPQALLNQHAAMQQLAKARFQVSQQFALLSKDSILFDVAGQSASIQENVANKTKAYTDKYKQFVVDYAQEWYKVSFLLNTA